MQSDSCYDLQIATVAGLGGGGGAPRGMTGASFMDHCNSWPTRDSAVTRSCVYRVYSDRSIRTK